MITLTDQQLDEEINSLLEIIKPLWEDSRSNDDPLIASLIKRYVDLDAEKRHRFLEPLAVIR